jgi:hypothetical protein
MVEQGIPPRFMEKDEVMANQEEIKKRLTDILLRYNIYMDGVGAQGDHNHMADSLTLEVEKMLSEEKATGMESVSIPIGFNPETQMYHVLQIDKEHHAAYATLIERDKQAIRDIVREEITQALMRNTEERALLEEASDLLSDAVDVVSYGRDASGPFSIYKAKEWERRYRSL